MAKQWLFSFLFIAISINYVLAQNSFTISGTIKDSKETLPGAAIYVSGYKIATTSNNDGNFILQKLAPGNYDILVQMIGYLPYSKNIVISNKSVNINVLLTENTTLLKEVVIKPDPNRAYYLALFKDFFIGKTPNSQACKILNTEVIIISDDKTQSKITARATDFILIENKALGYTIKYLLDYFEYDYKTKMIYYAGHPSFEEMKGNNSKQKKWNKNREIAYHGSIQHFFKSLYQNTTNQEGFIINKMSKVPNKNRPPDSLINANVKRLISGKNGTINVLTFNGTDSLSYWLKKRKEPKEFSVLSRKDVLTDTLVKNVDENLKMIKFLDDLYISYKNEKETAAFDQSGLKQNRPADLSDYQISVIELLLPAISFYKNGGILDPRSTLYKGYWAYEKVADMVPMDYLNLILKK